MILEFRDYPHDEALDRIDLGNEPNPEIGYRKDPFLKISDRRQNGLSAETLANPIKKSKDVQ